MGKGIVLVESIRNVNFMGYIFENVVFYVDSQAIIY